MKPVSLFWSISRQAKFLLSVKILIGNKILIVKIRMFGKDMWRVLIEISILRMPGEYVLQWIYHARFPVLSQREFICMKYKLVPLLEELSSERVRQIVVRSSVLQAQLITTSLSWKAFSTKIKVFLPGCSLFCKFIYLLKGQRKRSENT